MSAIAELLQAKAEGSLRIATPASPPSEPRAFSWRGGSPVEFSPDLERILAIPRRDPSLPPDLAPRLTEQLKTPTGTMSLRALQAQALEELRIANGLLALITVGGGKSLVALLAPVICDARVTVIMVPPALKDQLIERQYPEYAQHWRLPRLVGGKFAYPHQHKGVVHVVSYSELSSIRGAGKLDELQPDLLVCDEAHNFKHSSAARTKRFLRYARQAHSLGKCKFVFLSGTLISKSIRDAAHLGKLALGQNSPFPFAWDVLEQWSGALDPVDFAADPGALQKLCRRGESVREGFRRRLVETPGVVASTQTGAAMSLVIRERELKVPKTIRDALQTMRDTWCTPGTEDSPPEEISDALSMWRHVQEVSCGLFYRRTWPRAEPLEVRKEWLEARNAYFAEVRRYLTYSAGPGMDSPKLLTLAAARGRWASEHYDRWAAIHRSARPSTEAVWVDTFLAEDAAEWGTRNRGIIWSSIKSLGHRIAELGGFKYFGGKAETPGRTVDDADPKQSIVASVDSWGTGKDGFQQRYSTQLVTVPFSSGKEWTQVLGRLHREHQAADEVECWTYRHTPELRNAIQQAQADSRFITETTGDPQKLTTATILF